MISGYLPNLAPSGNPAAESQAENCASESDSVCD